ncbi:MAG: phosphopantetheine-binding protein [Microthrixaceae bacterium]
MAGRSHRLRATGTGPTGHLHRTGERLAATTADRRRELVAEIVRGYLAEMLGIDAAELDLDSPIGDYGVDSLVGMELRSRIDKEFHYLVPLSDLSRTMAVNELAAHLDAAAVPLLIGDAEPTATVHSELLTVIPVREAAGTPTWWLPDAFAAPDVFTEMGRRLDGVSVLVIVPPWMTDDTPVEASVTEVARRAVETIRGVSRTAPTGSVAIHSAGWSPSRSQPFSSRRGVGGAPLAFGPAATHRRRPAGRRAQLRDLLVDHLDELFPAPPGAAPLRVDDLDPETGVDPLVAQLRDRSDTTPVAAVATRVHRLLTALAAARDAIRTYRPARTTSVPVRFFHATEGQPFTPAGDLAGSDWAAWFSTPPTMVAVESDHHGLMRAPHVEGVAATIGRDVRRDGDADERGGPMNAEERTVTQRPSRGARIVEAIAASDRARTLLAKAGAGYRQADFYLNALSAEHRFRRLCTAGEGFIVGPEARITNLSDDPTRVQFGDHCLIDGFLNVQRFGRFSMGSYSAISTQVRIDCAGYVEIGDGCALAEGVYILDGLHHPILIDERIEHGIDLFEGDHILDGYGPGTETSYVVIGDLVWVGLRAIIMSGVTIGRGSVVSAGAVVTQDVPPYVVVAGNPARIVARLPPDDIEISEHPRYRRSRGDRPLPSLKHDPHEVLREIATRVARFDGTDSD